MSKSMHMPIESLLKHASLEKLQLLAANTDCTLKPLLPLERTKRREELGNCLLRRMLQD